ncbi:Ubiquinone biosynthesis O-methyltransferase, mitochondrial [Achromobacter mucicolens]|uniref:class I SAM-dependent methyltransferase n=1 Tax=Achromobacter mucicolens TaxID=1389922 RepID=UPI000B92044A|nr:class I SAM-dependent methyltransferase [Achromobacter mucicolens]OXC90291.1 hypothetical protein BMR85_014535 [Achromobacter sp. KAs 3-5]CAB3688900.1 Ubiquinone biosynthesis O-methyltransferase, mitochondrial [Achromobacter mucicolens]
MERLNFDENTQYDGLEAAIHIARYSFAQPYCADKRVLDVACGEGYGSRLLADWGASEVVGVDISADAVHSAQRHFGGGKVSFIQSEGETLLEKFEPESFDLIVSFETIEHVVDPVKFLTNVKRLLKPGGVIAISCPNDWWYFPTEEERNPYHLRKYTFDEFKGLTEGVLGQGKGWFLGGPMTGFLNLRLQQYPADDGKSGQRQMLNLVPLLAAQLVPSDHNVGPQPGNASYFVGIWTQGELGGQGISAGGAILPLSMDSFRTGIFRGHLPSVKEALEALRAEHQAETEAGRIEWERKAHAFELRLEALSLELQLTREQLADRVHRLAVSEQAQASMAWSAARYERISGMVPEGLRRFLMSLYRRFRKSGRGDR